MAAMMNSTSRAMWAARPRRLEAAFSDTISLSSFDIGPLDRSAIAFNAPAAGANKQPHEYKEYVEYSSVFKLEH